MRVKMASNKSSDPITASTIAANIFGREGPIHQKFLNDRLNETSGGTKPITEKRETELAQMEIMAIKNESKPAALKRYKIVIDEAAWAAKRDQALEEALTQRWKRDARFRRILEAARNKNKTILYFTPGTSTNPLGGVFNKADGRIDGDNRVGNIMMKLAGYPS
jgi:hypothetical protein